MRYRTRFFFGVGVSFIVALLNGLSLSAFVPLFDALGDKNEVFAIQFSDSERRILNYVVANYSVLNFPDQKRPEIPPSPKKIKQQLSKDLLHLIRHRTDFGLGRVDQILLQTVILWKLRINGAGYSPVKIVYTAALIVLPLYILKLILHLWTVRLIAGTGYMAVRDLRKELYRKTQRLPLTFFYKEKTGLIMSRLINDVEVVSAVISSNLRDAITNFFYIVTHVFLLAYLNSTLLLVSAIGVPIMLSPVTLFSRKIRRSTHRSQELLADLNAHLQEAISGVRVIRAFGAEDYEKARFRKVNDRLYWRKFKQEYYLKMGPNMVELTSAMVTLGIIVLGALFLDQTNFTGGEFLAFLVTLLFIIRPVIQLSGMYSKLQQADAAGDRIFEMIDRESEVVDPESPVKKDTLGGEIVFDNVRFTYPEGDTEVIKGISLNVPVGSTVAIVGESGGGKSTLMDLLARFFDVDEGRILINGNDIRDYRIKDHRSRIGIVTQEIFLFHGSIHDNIAYGNPNHTREDVENAARLAHAHEFIQSFPDTYDTILGERGGNLSGGQRQRIAIARALLRDPEILILDEATSALDTESERIVQDALERLFQNRTTFVIAHRLSTIEKADIIVVISEGKIVDQGTHVDLMNREGLYARLQEISRSAAELS